MTEVIEPSNLGVFPEYKVRGVASRCHESRSGSTFFASVERVEGTDAD